MQGNTRKRLTVRLEVEFILVGKALVLTSCPGERGELGRTSSPLTQIAFLLLLFLLFSKDIGECEEVPIDKGGKSHWPEGNI